ncbi:MAG: hypothetical protein H0T88_03215 [Lysobacter sp.]|nr:hypothetical protein [Lysobacter sp.]MDQ3511703.1 hypothetical protein [Pseudomonadota bacterium]
MKTCPNHAQDLANVVPLRLFELHRFDADSGAAGNAARFVRPRTTRDLRGGYARPARLPTRFSVLH